VGIVCLISILEFYIYEKAIISGIISLWYVVCEFSKTDFIFQFNKQTLFKKKEPGN